MRDILICIFMNIGVILTAPGHCFHTTIIRVGRNARVLFNGYMVRLVYVELNEEYIYGVISFTGRVIN